MRFQVLPAVVHAAQQRLELGAAVATRDDDTTVADVATAFGCSVPQVYKLRARVLDALTPGPRAPRPLTLLRAAPAVAPAAPPRDPRGPALAMAVANVSLRGQRTLFAAFGQAAPALDTLSDLLQRAGRAARRLLARANAQVRDRLTCLAGDDIFFHRTPIKVVVEPVSGALLEVQRWPWHAGEDWDLFLGEWPALKLWISDLGTDLVGAAAGRKLAHQADAFHERAWWTEHLFAPLSRREAHRAAEAERAWDRATRPQGPGRRASPATVAAADARRAAAEADFYAAVAAEEVFLQLLQPLAPDGRRWCDAHVADVLAALDAALAVLPPRFATPARSHVRRHRTRWCAHRVLWDAIPVVLAAGTTWTRETVLDAVVARAWAVRRGATATTWTAGRAAQSEAAALATALAAACANVADVTAAVASLLDRPRRSSSLVEALNSRLRVLQQVHRNVSDELLALVALAWNLTPRRDGRRRGASPYARLGIAFADDTRPWYELLLEAMDAA
jgi:hypothetical protein